MTSPLGNMRTSIRLNVVSVCLVATVLTAGLAIGLQYYFGQALARQAANDLYTTVSYGIAEKMRSVATVNANVIDLLAQNPVLRDPGAEREQLAIFTQVLQKNPLYYGVYIGRSDGTFYEVINLDISNRARADLQAVPTDRWLVITVSKGEGGWSRHYQYLDAELSPRHSHAEPTDYDLRSRPWYRDAVASSQLQVSEPYLFAQLGAPGRTLSKKVAGTETVVAIDMTLDTISDFLASQRLAGDGALYLYRGDGKVIASSLPPDPAAAEAPGMQTVPSDLLVEIAADPVRQEQLLETEIDGRTLLVYGAASNVHRSDALFIGILTPLDAVLAPFLDKVRLSIFTSAALLLLLLPLSWIIANPIVRPVKQLAVENEKVRRREYAQVSRVSTQVKELDELSGSMLDMVSSIQSYELAQRKLMDAIIELIAQAIDDKSAYTSGHCERVPELAMMIASAASQSDLPAFDAFELSTDDQWREYRIAAWLHDCGKITTPEHIVDKGSKLEVIYNRIHEIRTRFEVLWRDAEIAFWKGLVNAPDRRSELEKQLQDKQRQLQEDFEFVAHCNVGGESLAQEKQERLLRIAGRTWLRYFDDQIGLSPVEELRNQAPPCALPATEQLLSDKPQHVIERTRPTDYPPHLGIDMEIPEKLYNQGEIYNLSVSRGTLTTEDRFRINEHMISTIKMLENLPFPPELKNVPRYASTHHETMKGSGYPRKLSGEQLSIPERILAVADVFEALTAADRPYKKAKPVSEAVQILHNMVLDNHIDRDCFELFLSSGVYMDYARQYLRPDQVDPVDVSAYLSEEYLPASTAVS